MPDVNLASLLFKRFEERAVAQILNDQAMSVNKRVAYMQEGTIVIDEDRLRIALRAAYIKTHAEIRGAITSLCSEGSGS